MKAIFGFAVACWLLGGGMAHGADELFTTKLNGLEIGIDTQTGGVRRLASAATGNITGATHAEASLLNVAYPVQEFLPLRLGTAFSRGRVEPGANGVKIVWDELGPSRTRHAALPAGKVRAEAEFRAAPDGRSVVLTCEIDNASSGTIPQIFFPDLQGVQPFAGQEQTTLQFANGAVKPFAGPARTFEQTPASWITDVPFWVNQGWHTYPAVGLYAANALRWLDLGSHTGGLSIFQKRWGGTMIPTVLTHRTEANPNQMRLVWENRVTVGPGEKWNSDEIWLTPHAGGWAKGIEVFRDYVQKVNPPRALPAHVRDGIGFMSIMMSTEAETDPEKTAFRFKDLPRIAKDAHEYGIDELVPWLWCRVFNLPIRVDERLGTTEEFIEAIRQCKKLGVNVSPFVDVIIVPKKLAQERYGTPKESSGFQGSSLIYHPELIPNIDAYYMEPSFVHAAPAGYPGPLYDITLLFPDKGDAKCNVKDGELWVKDSVAAFKEWIDRGVTSFAWDLFHSVVTPGGERSIVVDVAQQLRALARERDPEAVFCAESTSNVEYDSPVVDYTWDWARSLDSGPVMNVLRTPRENYNVEDSITELKSAFCAGLYINVMPRRPDAMNGSALIGEKPEFAAALKEVAGLRKQYLPYFVDGLALGDSVLSEQSEAFVRGYQLGNRLLLIALNISNEARTFTLKSDLALWNSVGVGAWDETYRGGKKQTAAKRTGHGSVWAGTTEKLKPLEMAFFEIEMKPATK